MVFASFAQHEGRVIARVKGTNKVLFEQWNKVTIAGSAYTAMKHFPNMILSQLERLMELIQMKLWIGLEKRMESSQ